MRVWLLIYSLALLFIMQQSLWAKVDHSAYKASAECLDCHKKALPTHRLARPQNMPEGLPLDSTGSMICLTCHNCISGTCILRNRSPELCRTCHDCTQGMACLTGIAHMGDSPYIEKLSFENCRGCHDGSIGKDVGGPKDHKIDVVYIPGKDFNKVKDRRVIFINNKVKCISCHNPYKNEDHRLVKSNKGSRLCLTCHRK